MIVGIDSMKNVPENIEQQDWIPVEPSKHQLLVPNAEIVHPANELAEPRASIDTVCSLDISDNIPNIVFPMDAEDSPWGGGWRFWSDKTLQDTK